jgi:LysM repeat protein
MKALRELLLGVITTGASIVLVVGAILLTITEGMSSASVQTGAASTTLPTFTLGVNRTSQSHPKSTPKTPSPTGTYLPSPSVTPTAFPTANGTCSLPDGWNQYTIMSGDSIDSLANYYGIDQENLMSANCLVSRSLLPGTILFVPPFVPSSTPTARPTPEKSCTLPYGWGIYIVKTGDTLYRISQSYQMSVSQLQSANCLGNSTGIWAGENLFVPFVQTITPLPSSTNTSTQVESSATPNLAATETMIAAAQSQTIQAAQETQAAQEVLYAQQTQTSFESTAQADTQTAIDTANTEVSASATAFCETQIAGELTCP